MRPSVGAPDAVRPERRGDLRGAGGVDAGRFGWQDVHARPLTRSAPVDTPPVPVDPGPVGRARAVVPACPVVGAAHAGWWWSGGTSGGSPSATARVAGPAAGPGSRSAAARRLAVAGAGGVGEPVAEAVGVGQHERLTERLGPLAPPGALRRPPRGSSRWPPAPAVRCRAVRRPPGPPRGRPRWRSQLARSTRPGSGWPAATASSRIALAALVRRRRPRSGGARRVRAAGPAGDSSASSMLCRAISSCALAVSASASAG